MVMKRIGPVAAKLVRNPIELVAAANQSAARIVGEPVRPGGAATSSPGAVEAPRLNSGAAGTSNAIESAGPEGPASDGARGGRSAPMLGGGDPGKLKLVVNTGWRSVPRHNGDSPAPTLRRPVLTVVEGDRHHAASRF
jgi:hypothetical protein